jgi:hypothetical protein
VAAWLCPGSITYIPTGEATYSSSNTNIASVDINGTVTLSSFGQAVMTATYKGLTAQTTISSEPPRIGILFAITPTNGGFALGLITSVGTTNVVQASTNLVNWVDVQSIYSSNGFIRFEDNVNLPVRFYRVLQR